MSTKSLYNWWKVIGTPIKSNCDLNQTQADHSHNADGVKTMTMPNFYPYLTRFEMTELVATRAECLANNDQPRVSPDAWSADFDEIQVAIQEIHQNKLGDHAVMRRYPHNKTILIPVSELFVKSSY